MSCAPAATTWPAAGKGTVGRRLGVRASVTYGAYVAYVAYGDEKTNILVSRLVSRTVSQLRVFLLELV
jgi:hypothetical protein